MAPWQRDLDPYISVLPTNSAASLVIMLDMPNMQPSLHMTIYLPTSGKETEFVDELATVDSTIMDLREKYPGHPIYIRGDGNVNRNHKTRVALLQHIIRKHNIKCVPLHHNTYHHFVGNGESDSEIDLLMCIGNVVETVERIICKKENALLDSHHNMILSLLQATVEEEEKSEDETNPDEAPRINNERINIKWSEEGIHSYMKIPDSR